MKSLLSILLGILLSIELVTSQCGPIPWNKDNDQCSDFSSSLPDSISAYKEIRSNGQTTHFCCKRGDPRIEKHLKETKQCFATPCIFDEGLSVADLCPNREINGVLYELETSLTDTCTKGKKKGVQAQCCNKNSTEGVLLTRAGAEMHEFPHQASILSSGHGCGGTIYNKRYIITASHCVIENGIVRPTEKMRVTLGTNIGDFNEFDSDANMYAVEEVIYHKNYSQLKGQPDYNEDNKPEFYVYNDIALLKLDRDIDFSDNVKALPLAPKGLVPETFAKYSVVIGWGVTETGESSRNLHKANAIIRSDRACMGEGVGPWWGQVRKNPERVNQLLCMGGVLDGEYSPISGTGDSGGPAICRDAEGYAVLCGVTSFGAVDEDACRNNPNAKRCKPGIYAEVEHFREWIEDNTQHQGQDPTTLFKRKLYGEAVPQGEMEHQVHITSQDGKPCGGTLISEDAVLTAAQCVVKNDGTKEEFKGIEVFVGQRDLKGSGERYGVKKVTPLEGFQRQGDPIDLSKQRGEDFSIVVMTDNYHKNDLAIVKLDRAVGISSNKLPKLPMAGQTASGLAMEVAFRRNSTYGSELQQRQYRIIDQSECQARMNRMSNIGAKVKVDNETICGVETYSGGSLCDRELGGGLICKGNVLCGVQNFRLCDTTMPNGFVNVAEHRDWIDEKKL